ncbi:thiol-disulfide oxidoreductase DCC family protein [Paenibacillus sp. N1-5-1-14]|uniref:thiol-disulfide oxidoreductase DCC family protein n=1 Tax=Paenibacillus radicibacter TaxID=2972488 RepID=UPI0021592AC0|nr:thiol-disulfide oxidoreductase DCC family protein [Paenibacillus radicibacter]MCR8644552.1 thiol-disulfide oxidoreductase DCC family protein [Paenibacillus radicibacter]
MHTGTDPQSPSHPNAIVLFDGVCNMCNSIVKFTIRRDPTGKLRFASLQSDAGQRLLESYNLSTHDFNSFVLIEGNRAYTKSSAALRLTRKLHLLWPCLYIGIVIPKPIRDLIYHFVAHNRYRWFGQAESCMMPTPELKQRFLNE